MISLRSCKISVDLAEEMYVDACGKSMSPKTPDTER